MRCGLKIPSRGQLFGITGLAEWCRTVILSDRIFSLQRTTIIDSFPYIHFHQICNYAYKCVLIYWFNAKISTFAAMKCSVQLSTKLTLKQTKWRKMMSKLITEGQKDVLKSCTSSHLTPSCVRRHFLVSVSDAEFPVRYARKVFQLIICNLTLQLNLLDRFLSFQVYMKICCFQNIELTQWWQWSITFRNSEPVKLWFEPWHDKTNKVTVRPGKTPISLGICPVWSESSLCAQWVAKDPSFLHADSEDSDQTGRMPRLIWVFAGRTAILLVLSCRGSNIHEKVQVDIDEKK